MSFRYQKRVNLGKGIGLNVSQSGISTSYRSKFGSIGSRGFSLKTGIPGLTYRSSFGKGLLPALLIYVVAAVAVLVVYNLARLIYFLVRSLYFSVRLALARR